MGNLSTDQKLQLIQMIRAESQDNRIKMRSREKMLYGTEHKDEELPLYAKGCYNRDNTYAGKGKYEKELHAQEEGDGQPLITGSSFRLRLLLAAVLFAAFLVLDGGGGMVGGITTEEIRGEINKDFDVGLDEVVFDFEENFPYTLFSDD